MKGSTPRVARRPKGLEEVDYRLVLDALADPVVVAGGDGHILYANVAAGSLLGWKAADLVGQPLTVIIPSRLRARHLGAFEQHQATHIGRLIGRGVRVPAMRRNGTEVRVELSLSELPSGAGGAYVGFLRRLGTRAQPDGGRAAAPWVPVLLQSAVALNAVSHLDELPRKATELLSLHLGATLARIWLNDAATDTLHQPMRVRRRGVAPEPL